MAARIHERIMLGRDLRTGTAGNARFIEASYAPFTRFASHAHDKANITLVIRGEIKETVAHQTIQASSFSVVVKPAGTVHANCFGAQGAHTFLVETPFDQHIKLNQWRWFHGGEIAAMALRVYRDFRCRRCGPDSCLHTGLIDLVSLIASHLERPPSKKFPAWIDRVRDRIHDMFPDCVSVVDLAEDVQVHPVYLARVFRARFGCTITEYMHRLRVSEAAHHLASSQQTLARVAYDAGFADQPHLCRIFKRQTRLTPGEFRRLVELRQV
jgi:AraC family transcriptional regulator